MVARRSDEPLFVALTADVDPDANCAVPGRVDAVSAGRTDGVSLEACFEGLAIVLDVLHAQRLPATFFHEARTLEELAARRPDLLSRLKASDSFEHACHGWRHEDFAGKVSGLPLSLAETSDIIARAGNAFAEVFGRAPRGFRAPYCRLTPALVAALQELGYAYDASLIRTASPEWRLRPYRLPGAPAVYELALSRSHDARGRPITSYLWQLFEGNRPVDDYVQLVASLGRQHAGGLLQIGIHPWHLVVSEDGWPASPNGQDAPALLLRQFLERAGRVEGVAFTTCAAYLGLATGGAAP